MINNIQALRAFAAINVVLFHIIETSASYSKSVDFFGHLQGWGANGVDIFFVISGFVMLQTQLLQRRSPYQFLKSRVIRIIPIYWCVTLFVLCIYVFLPSAFREMVVTPTWLFSSLFFTSSLFTDNHPIVYVGWTLEWEMLFYIIFSVSLFFKTQLLKTGFVAISICFASFLVNNFIAVEFLFGMLVACIYRFFSPGRIQGAIILFLGASLLFLSISPAVAGLELNRVIIWGLPSFLIVCGSQYCPQVKSHLFTYLGDASYSIYLVQVLTIPAFYKLSSKILRDWNGDVLVVFCLISTIAFGCIIYSLIEKPTTAKIKRIM